MLQEGTLVKLSDIAVERVINSLSENLDFVMDEIGESNEAIDEQTREIDRLQGEVDLRDKAGAQVIGALRVAEKAYEDLYANYAENVRRTTRHGEVMAIAARVITLQNKTIAIYRGERTEAVSKLEEVRIELDELRQLFNSYVASAQ